MLVHEALMRNLRDRRFTPELLAKRLIVRGAERPALDYGPAWSRPWRRLLPLRDGRQAGRPSEESDAARSFLNVRLPWTKAAELGDKIFPASDAVAAEPYAS